MSTIAMMAIGPNPWKESGIKLCLFYLLDKVRLNLFHSYPHINIFP